MIFNGWYVDEEIAANLLDPNRYAWTDRVGAAIHGPAELARLRRTDRLDEYGRAPRSRSATLRATRQRFQGRAQAHQQPRAQPGGFFGKFHERYLAAHGEPPPNDTGWTANRSARGTRQPSHARCRTSRRPAGQLS